LAGSYHIHTPSVHLVPKVIDKLDTARLWEVRCKIYFHADYFALHC
jgi:hypothetical protein